MPQSYRHTYPIDTRDLDCFDRCRPSAVLGYLQDVAGLAADLPEVEHRALHYSDLDANGHVNNTRYADFLCDALALQTAPKDAFVSKVQLNYLKECRAGETLTLKAGWQGDEGLVSGEGPDGEVRFSGALTLSKSFP